MNSETGSNGSAPVHSRRDVFRMGGGLALSIGTLQMLAACGVGTGSGGGARNSSVRTALQGPSARAAVPMAQGQLDFLGYEGDDALDLTKIWRKSHTVALNSSYTSSASEIQAKFLGGGGGGVDLTSQLASEAPYLTSQNLLAPINPDHIPNLSHIWPFFAQNGGKTLLNEHGQWTSIPIFWGTIGLAWDRSVFADVTAWEDILNPAFRGSVGMLDSPQLALYAACSVLDLQTNRLTTGDLKKVEAFLRPIMAQTKTFTPSVGDLISLLGSREIGAVFPGFAFIANAAVAQGNKDATYNIHLEEGAPVLIETVGISAKADNPDTASAFINELLSPRVQVGIATAQGAAVTVDNAASGLPKDIKSLYPYEDLTKFFESTAQFIDPPLRSSKYVTSRDIQDMWVALKRSR